MHQQPVQASERAEHPVDVRLPSERHPLVGLLAGRSPQVVAVDRPHDRPVTPGPLT
ncbi:hypothetical protein RHCRD62_40311 [Rhodococcus sp. RD6.2]|nr:hypothetical protein RHCRD62_40311 [Rhodococcus sp. RD6.2]